MPSELRSQRRDIGRLNAFTDGVMVVAMTLLILNVELPDNVTKLDGMPLLHELHKLWPKYFGYVLSFLVIAKYWMGYTEKFGAMKEADSGFAWLNICFLMLIGFIPFVTTLLGDNDGQIATSLYAVIMILVSLTLVQMWMYAARNGLIESKVLPTERWREVLPWLQIAGVFGLSIIVALLHPHLAKLVWLLLLFPVQRLAPSGEPSSPG